MKGLHRVAVLVSCVVPFTASVRADPIEVPFRQHQHLIIVRGTANGRTDLNLVIDTGATYTVISRRLYKQLRLRTGTVSAVSWGSQVQVQTGKLGLISIGEMIFRDVEIRVGELSLAKGLRIDLLVGLDLLKRTNLTIDYVRRTLVFGSRRAFEDGTSFYAGLPFIPIRLEAQGKRLALVLDTGSPYLIFFRTEITDEVDLVRTKERKRINHAGGHLDLRKVVLNEARLGENSIGAFTAYLMDASSKPYGGADGILSPTAVGMCRIHLDFESNRISWEF